MIKKPQFINLIKEGKFKELFVTELGWYRYRRNAELVPISVDGSGYGFTAIAERSGFQILYSEVEEIPTQSVAKKIDTKLRRQAQDYICIYRLRGSEHDLWVVPVRANEKRDLVMVEYDKANAEVIYQKIEGITFDFDEQSNIVDLRNKVHSAFIVNSEKITKDFYAGFKKQHKAFADFISGIDDHIETNNNKNKQWYASVMLNRLMFCYFIQKKGFLAFDTEYLKHKLEYVRAHEGENQFYNFYRSFLRRLFRDGLNSPQHSRDFEGIFGKIPYLNGGMFDEHQLEADYADIDIPDEAFISLFDFFDKWNWHLDTRLTASGKDINPDVLGYIFEQYINDRAQMGAYYTKEDITEYIGRNCILPFLFDKVRNTTADSCKAFARDGFVWTTLRESGDRYIFDAVKKGYKAFGKIPASIARGIITDEMRKEYSDTPIGDLPQGHVPLSELRSEWNTRTPEEWGLPQEIWRETIERLQRCGDILGKIERGEISSINDFITYNLDIRSFAADLLAKANNKFVGWFYKALQEVTILDPTCGSGAFLFAAMNILEPLYEICIDRMQEFNQQNRHLFEKELAEITDKYRSNIQYFIYKSIILRNLYGVDIMVEATEIAKLRLFLKMVAVVDVDRRADNLGLDPLPDIDFNIRCGNTLVGYANKKQLEKDLNDCQGNMNVMLANDAFREQIAEEMDTVARTYSLFKHQQLRQSEDMAAFKQAKSNLRTRLLSLNDKLNRRLFIATTGYNASENEDFTKTKAYREWLSSHQPFHWLAEFYQIIEGNHGFDVIIGNPPYVVYNEKTFQYKVTNIISLYTANLFSFCIERSYNLINSDGAVCMIVPISIVNGPKYNVLRTFLNGHISHISNFSGDTHPGVLFTGVQQNLSILLIKAELMSETNVSNFIRFFNSERDTLFQTLKFITSDENENGFFKMSFSIQKNIISKIKGDVICDYIMSKNNNYLYKKTTSGSQYKLFFKEAPYFSLNGQQEIASSFKPIYFKTSLNSYIPLAIFNSNLFNLWWVGLSDGRNVTNKETDSIQIPKSILKESSLIILAKKLMIDLEIKGEIVTYNKAKGITQYMQYTPRLSKSIIDEIDTVLARHYGFSEEELDFIINYDIKYRMGDELNNGEE